MKKFLKALSVAALLLIMLFCSAGCNFFKSAPVKEFMNKYVGDIPGIYVHTHLLEKHDAVESTCTETGIEAYYSCTEAGCEKLFSDENGENQISEPQIMAKKAHSLTNTVVGNEEYWVCGVCTKIFTDPNGENETVVERVLVGLEVVTMPKDLTYYAGETFSAEGMELKAIYSDNNNETVTEGYTYAPGGALALTDTEVVVSYQGKTVSIPITVLDKSLEKVFVIEAETADLTGIVNAGTYRGKTLACYNIVDIAHASGGKAINNMNAAGNIISWTIHADKDAKAQVVINVAARCTRVDGKVIGWDIAFDEMYTVKVNGVIVPVNMNVTPPKGDGVETENGYYEFCKVSVEIDLKSGDNLISFTVGESAKAGNLDSLVFTTAASLENKTAGMKHSLIAVDEKPATCTEDGYKAYYNCSTCARLFSDAEGKNEISAPESISAKHTLTFVEAKESSCTEAGYEAYYKCVCDKLFSDAEATQEIPAPMEKELLAHSLTKTEKVNATEDTDGCNEYWTCGACKKIFADAKGERETTLEFLKIPATGHIHNGTYVEATAPTCTEDGYDPYYECACGKLFSDEACQQEIAEPVVVKAAHSLSKTVVESVEYWVCGVCSKIFADENAENETTIARTLLRIEVATMPTILEYKVGDTFKTTGMVLNAIYAEDYVEEISEGYTYTPDGELAVTDKEIVISYQDKTVSIAITVADPSEVVENTYTFEAENAVLSGIVNSGTFKGKELDCYNIVDVAHASGGKMINNMNTAENVISWTVNSDKAAQATITIYVAARCTKVDGIVYGWDVAFDQMYTLSINGEAVLIDTIVSPPKGNGVETDNGYYEICTVTTEVTLTNGENVISLTVSESVKAGNLDCIKVQTTAVLSDTTDGVKHIPTHLEAKASTCIETGYDAHYLCKCGKRYSDAEATNEVGDSVLKELTAHTLTKVTAGTEYWICGVCSKTFSDENGTTPTVVNINGIVDTTNWNTSTDFDAITADGKLAEGVTKSSGTTINVTRLNSRGVGCIGDLKTAGYYATFKIYSDKTEVVGLYVEFSNSSTKNSKDKFNDCYNLIVNGQEYKSDADMPYSSSANWTASNKYTLLGYVQLKEGINEITIKVASGFKYRHNVYSLKFTTETAVISWGNEE